MPDRRRLTAIRLAPAVVAAGFPALAETAPEPPLWALLAECSAVFEAVGQADGYAGTTEQQRSDAAFVAASFLTEAEKEAAAAGQADPKADVASIMGYLRERWSNRSEKLLALPSNMKWIDYCGALGRQRGILPLRQ
ncbi:hypothetical protein L0V05_04530 [Tabrizicola sp. J26]|nr:hypothetical protein [Tabrizicola rongguiensis]